MPPIIAATATKHPEIARRLRHEVLRGRFHRARQLPSNRELATLFDATPITVRKALQTLTDQGIVEVRANHGTFVARAVRELHPLAGIEVLVQEQLEPSHPYLAKLLAGLQGELSMDNGFSLHITPLPATGKLDALRTSRLRALDSGGLMDGVVMAGLRDTGVADFVWELGLPMVVVGDHAPGLYPAVFQDNAVGVRLLVERIVRLGCRRVHAIARIDPDRPQDAECHIATAMAGELAGLGIACRLHYVPAADDVTLCRRGVETLRELLAGETPPDCVLGSGTPLCEAIRPLVDSTEAVLIAHTDDPLPGYAHELVLPVSELGRQAGQLIRRQMVEGRQSCLGTIHVPMYWATS